MAGIERSDTKGSHAGRSCRTRMQNEFGREFGCEFGNLHWRSNGFALGIAVVYEDHQPKPFISATVSPYRHDRHKDGLHRNADNDFSTGDNAMTRNSTWAALCVLTAIGNNAFAQSQAQVYGTFDAAVGRIETQPPGAPNAAIVKVNGVHSGGMQTSHIGFRGSDDLGGGLIARFQLETFFRGDTGVPGRFDASPTSGADFFWSRESFVALGGGFGEVRLGNNGNPVWVSMLQTSAMGSNSVFSPSFRQLFNGGTRGRSEVDTALVNSVKYVSPVLAGFEGSVAVQAGEGSGTRYNLAFNLSYRSGPLLVALGRQDLKHAAQPTLPGARDQTLTLAGAAYDFGVARVFGQYSVVDNDRLRIKDKLPHVGLTVPLGGGMLQVATGQDRNTVDATGAVSKRKTTSLGYVYPLSKRTDLYSFVMADKVSVGTADSAVVGMRHRF